MSGLNPRTYGPISSALTIELLLQPLKLTLNIAAINTFRAQCYKTFLSVTFRNKLDCFTLVSLSSLVLCLQVRVEPTKVSTIQLFQFWIGSWPYFQTID
jgi:hypothetical protein